jgi:hypothetical protein
VSDEFDFTSIGRMQKFHTADGLIFIGYLTSLLEAEGNACSVRNEMLIGGSGELPPNECWPELWVLHDTDVLSARKLIEGVLNCPPDLGFEWQCSHCQEESEAQFTACWKCGSLRR